MSQTKVPDDIAAEVMFRSNLTCCICNERGNSVNIHHIDGNHENNSYDNLAVLCLQCHDKTQTKGGFGRSLNAPLVIRYRDDWVRRVQRIRDETERYMISKTTGENISLEQDEDNSKTSYFENKIIVNIINSLPAIRLELLAKSALGWDTGITQRMREATYEYIDALQGILVILSNFYQDESSFEGDANRFIFEIIASRYKWHNAYAEPGGPGSGGTIISLLCGGNVMDEVETMVEEMVFTLVEYYKDSEYFKDFQYKEWRKRWKERSKQK